MKQVIILRKDLNMRKGKMVAQGAHASMAAIISHMKPNIRYDHDYSILKEDSRISEWLSGLFTKICVSVNSEKELLNIYAEAKEKKMLCSLIQDSGLTEFNLIPTYTAVAIGPDTNENLDKITGHLKLL